MLNDSTQKQTTTMSRLTSVELQAVGFGQAGELPANDSEQEIPSGKLTDIELLIDGRGYPILVEPRWSLLHVLREKLGMTSTKIGCDRGECGACTVLIDDLPQYSCLTLALEAEGKTITTLAGLMTGDQLGNGQQAFLTQDAFQCGYCTPGQIMAAEGLLRVNPDPSLEEIRRGVSSNICRCGAYNNIFKAVLHAVKLRNQK